VQDHLWQGIEGWCGRMIPEPANDMGLA